MPVGQPFQSSNKLINNKTALSNVPGTPAPPVFPNQRPEITNSKLPKDLDKNFKEPDINKLPRAHSASDQLVAAIEDVNQKLNNNNLQNITPNPEVFYL